jgi:hypothetical protein
MIIFFPLTIPSRVILIVLGLSGEPLPPGPRLQQACIYETFCSLLLLQYVVVLTAASPAILLVDPVFLTKRFLSHSTRKKETPFQVRIKVPFVLSPIPICRCRRGCLALS